MRSAALCCAAVDDEESTRFAIDAAGGEPASEGLWRVGGMEQREMAERGVEVVVGMQ